MVGEVEEYLKCGDLQEGFARVRCTNQEWRQIKSDDILSIT
jgi:hypothetical protein